ncbi:MAG TPA: condensation domain-containing protein, partial [Thermoanaerobaculia bacterium]|nr:condensation domain-containing protein [Thermoanaerobaculia bacterium]
AARHYGLGGGGGAVLHTGLAFDLTVTSLLGPLLSGGTVVVAAALPDGTGGVAGLAQALARGVGVGVGGVGMVKLTPSHLPLLELELAERLGSGGEGSWSGLCEVLVLGGEALTGASLGRWRRQAPELRVINEYGPTEAVVGCCVWGGRAGGLGEGRVAIGRPIDGVRLYVVDRGLAAVAAGIEGELVVGGAGLARGYLGDAARTAERFVPDPFGAAAGQRLYRTGDRVRRDATGVLWFAGRLDEQVKIRGYRVEPGEVEAALGRHPGVREAAVVAREDRPGERRLVAYVVGTAGAVGPAGAVAPAAEELRRFLGEWLPAALVPAVYVALAELPRTGSGKVDRRALLALPEPERRPRAPAWSVPRTAVEELLAGIWEEVLRVERVGRTDSFFDLGGHSLLATQVLSRVQEALGVELAMHRLFERPTVAGLAEEVAAASLAGRGAGAPPPLAARSWPGGAGGSAPLSFAQERLWLLDRLDPGDLSYNLPAAVRMVGPLVVAHLEASLGEVVRRHGVLRTRFAVVGERPVQVVAPPAVAGVVAVTAGVLPRIDLDGLPAARRQGEAERWMMALTRRPFDLSAGPPLRLALLRLGAEEHVALLVQHHIISDAWSAAVLVRELGELMGALSRGEPARLPALPVQYADFAAWQREWLQGEVLAQEVAHWRRELAGAPEVLELWWDRPRPAGRGEGQWWSGRQPLRLEEGLVRQLRAFCRREGVTLYMLLLAAWASLLGRHGGGDDILVGSPVANRNRVETEGLIGFFVNMLVLRVELGGDPSGSELAARVRGRALAAYAHQDLPFARLVAELRPRRSFAHGPLYQVALTVQNAPEAVLAIPGLTLEVMPAAGAAPAPTFLSLEVFESAAAASGALYYRRDLLDPPSAARLAWHWQTLLAGLVADPAARLAQLPLLSAAESAQLLVEWNDTAAAPPAGETLHGLFAARLALAPDQVAASCEDGALTRGELDRRANRLARRLRALGVGPEVVVGICLERSPARVAAALAVLAAGGACLPLDPAYPAARLALLLRLSRAALLLTRRGLVALPATADTRVICLDVEDTEGVEIAGRDARAPHLPALAENLALVAYTSGSRGLPQEILVPHRALAEVSRFAAEALARGPADPVVQLLPWAADGFTLDLLRALGSPPGERRYPNLRLQLVDPALRQVPIGVAGEVLLGGCGLPRGHHRRADLTAEALLPAPFATAPGERLVRTGRLARYLADGRLEHLGRREDQVKPVLPDPEPRFEAPRTEVEQRLAAIWSELLRIDRVGVHDNFFELGGDSILAIQMVARANARGVRLASPQVFERQTIAALAAAANDAGIAGIAGVVGRGAGAGAEQGPVGGEVPLTPIQHWFFERRLDSPQHFNQSLLMAVDPALPVASLPRALAALGRHHDALRLRFLPAAGGGWRQLHAGVEEPGIACCRLDLRGLPAGRCAAAVAAAAGAAQASLDLGRGPLARALLFEAAGGPPHLLLVAHHLVIDGVSWRILVEDLQRAWEGLPLPAKTTSFKAWAERLAEHARGAGAAAELESWLCLPWESVARLTPDLAPAAAPGEDREGAAATVTASLSATETRDLLRALAAAPGSRLEEALLAAVADAFAGLVRGILPVECEAHGREPLFPDLDLTRTVGWFTSLYPLLLDLDRPGGAVAQLQAVRERLRPLPHHGLGWGVLRYLGDGGQRRRLASLAPAQVSFNYFGQLDVALPERGLLRPVPLPGGSSPRAPRQLRSHLLAIDCRLAEGRLSATWTYGSRQLRRRTIAALAGRFAAALRALAAGGGEAAPERRTGEPVVEAYPLSPVQQGMLFHSLYRPEAGEYVVQVSCMLRGDLDAVAFRGAWDEVIARHAGLRTSFVWERRGEPLQRVHREVTLPWQQADWSARPEAARRAALAELKRRELDRGFDLTSPPLLRVALVAWGEDAHAFVWTGHHLLLDGWSFSSVLAEVFALYGGSRRGRPAMLPPSRSFGEYIAWLQRQDVGAAEAFWRRILAGVSAPMPLGIDAASGGEERQAGAGAAATAVEPQPGRCRGALDAAATSRLQGIARRQRLTMATLVQGAWGVLLARYGGGEDVLFGLTLAGRPAELPGIESMVGLFIATLPQRLAVAPQARVLPWLEELQARAAEVLRHQHVSLAQIQGWSEVPRGTRLFESLLVFESYPVEAALAELGRELEADELETVERLHYPLQAVVVPGAQLRLTIDFDRARFTAPVIRRLLAHLQALLSGMAERPEARLGELALLSAGERQQLVVEWNEGGEAAGWPGAGEATVHGRFSAQARRTPAALAVVDEGRRASYGEVEAESNRWARLLGGLGVGPEVRVGLCVRPSLAMVVAVLGVLKAGGAYVPLDPQAPPARLDDQLADAGAAVVLVGEGCEEAVPAAGRIVVPLAAGWESGESAGPAPAAAWVAASSLAYVIYTSGSTGRAKGVMVPHGGVVSYLEWAARHYGLGGGGGAVLHTGLAFDLTVTSLLGPLLSGGTVVVAAAPPDGTGGVSGLARALVRGVGVGGVGMVKLTPSHLPLLELELAERLSGGGEGSEGSWSGLCEVLVLGGEALTGASLGRWRRQAPELRVINEY